jgi:hypothetical protein
VAARISTCDRIGFGIQVFVEAQRIPAVAGVSVALKEQEPASLSDAIAVEVGVLLS